MYNTHWLIHVRVCASITDRLKPSSIDISQSCSVDIYMYALWYYQDGPLLATKKESVLYLHVFWDLKNLFEKNSDPKLNEFDFKGNNKCTNKCIIDCFKNYKYSVVNIIWDTVKHAYHEK